MRLVHEAVPLMKPQVLFEYYTQQEQKTTSTPPREKRQKTLSEKPVETL
jgi:hypothetical protein